MRTFDWELLPYFLAVARAGSLRAAAEITTTSYGTVNRNIQALETSYGVRLFHRTKRGFRLTQFGETLLPAAEAAEAAVFAARKKVEGTDRSESGLIRFSVTPTIGYDIVAPIIARFQNLYPNIDLQLTLTPEIQSITNDETDVSLRAAATVTDDVVARKLLRFSIGIYAHRDYVETILPGAGPNGTGLTWLGPAALGVPAPFGAAKLRHDMTDGYMRIKLLLQGAGLSALPTVVAKTYPDLVQIPGTELTKGPWLWILLHSDLRKTTRVRRFVDFLADELMALKG